MAHRVMFYVFIRISYMIIFTCQNSETVRICRFHQLAEVFRKYSNVCHLLLCTKKKKKKPSQVAQMVKNPPAVQETPGLIPGLERSPGEGTGNPLQYSCLENPLGRAA